jgi:hypothetical protein
MTKEERAERLHLAYEIAWSIHHNKLVAYLIAMEAVYRWEVLPPQGQRLLSKEQKFQRLVFEVSTCFERAIEAISIRDDAESKEHIQHLVMNMRHLESTKRSIPITATKYLSLLSPKATNLEEQTMMTHYIKHLAMIALRHSLVKTTVSHLQLLYRFATNETRSIYEHLETALEKAGEVKDLQFFAKARRELLDDLRNRFGALIRIELCLAPNGAATHQLAASPATHDQTDFVEACLREFAPRDVRRSSWTPSKLRNKGEFVYQLLYPEQFQVVLAETGLSAVPHPMFWPVFTNTEKSTSPPSPRQLPSLRDREVRVAVSKLGLAAQRRQQWSGRLLQIVVDGREYTQLDLDETSQTTLRLGSSTATIEVLARAEEVDILLAQFLFSEEEFDPEGGPSEHVVVLGGGRKITFALTPGVNGEGAEITIGYQEPFMARIASKVNLTPYVSMLVPQAAVPLLLRSLKGTISLAALCLTVFLGLRFSQSLMIPHIITQKDIPALTPASPNATGGRQSHSSTLGHSGGNENSSPSEQQQPPFLCEISIRPVGGNRQFYQAVETRLAHKLSPDTTRLRVVPYSEKRDAFLNIKADWQYGILGRIFDWALIEVRLADNTGKQTLWPLTSGARQYQGNSDGVIDAIAQDMMRDLINAKRLGCKN